MLVIKKLLKIVETAVMMIVIVLIHNCVRFVCIITDPEEPRYMVYRLVTVLVFLLVAVLGWVVVSNR